MGFSGTDWPRLGGQIGVERVHDCCKKNKAGEKNTGGLKESKARKI
jgi:hypothetical protein